MNTSGFRQRGIRADADGHHHQVGRYFLTIFKADRCHAPGLADELFGLLAHQEIQPFIFQALLQHGGSYRIKLTLHEAAGEVYYGDIHAT